jgi:ABC-2 type transport system ATP-binding protein
MRSGSLLTGIPPVLAAGVGVKHGWGWVLRAASFRVEAAVSGQKVMGIAVGRRTASSALVNLLAGAVQPAHGELRVLGEDLTTPRGRAAVRPRIGVARRGPRPQPAFRVRGVVEHAARLAGMPWSDRDALTAAILDRLGLVPWARVPLHAAPPAIARRVKLAAAAVHEPDLLLLDGLLDGLGPRDVLSLAAGILDLAADTAIIATGSDASALRAACGEVLVLANGIIVPN